MKRGYLSTDLKELRGLRFRNKLNFEDKKL